MGSSKTGEANKWDGVIGSIRAALWDAHYGKGLSVEYAHSADSDLDTLMKDTHALQEQNRKLVAALEYIFDHDDDCECECNNENCCVRQPSMGGVGTVFCPRCIARAALKDGQL